MTLVGRLFRARGLSADPGIQQRSTIMLFRRDPQVDRARPSVYEGACRIRSGTVITVLEQSTHYVNVLSQDGLRTGWMRTECLTPFDESSE